MTVKADKPCNGTCVTESVLRPVNRDWLARRHVMFRGNANNDNCSPRYLNANNRPSNTNANIGCAAQDGFYPFAAFSGQSRCPGEANTRDKASRWKQFHQRKSGCHWRSNCPTLAGCMPGNQYGDRAELYHRPECPAT